MALNDLGEEMYARPVTLPPLKLLPIDDAAERRELAERLAEQRTIRAGRDAWEAINKAESFDGWKTIGAALAIGREYALRATGADAPMGRRYSWTFSAWCRRHGFGKMSPATRSWALALHENLAAITAWRDGLPSGRGRRPPVNPQSCVKGWQRSQHGNGHQNKGSDTTFVSAVAAWRRFLCCVAGLSPADQAAMWAIVYETKVIADAA
jgi:hypothetical protein